MQALPQVPQFELSTCKFLHPAGLTQQVEPGAQAPPPLQEQSKFGPVFLQASPGAQVAPSHTQRPAPLQTPVPVPPPSLHWEAPVHWHVRPAQVKPLT